MYIIYMYMYIIYMSMYTSCTLNVLHIHDTHVHVLMRDERRKKERSKQRQTNKQGKAT